MIDLDVGALRRYLIAEGIAVEGELRWELIAGGRSNLTYRVADDEQAWVLRRPPVAGLTPSAHDVAREYRVTDALQKASVPVAATVVACSDLSVLGAPFTLVEYVPGRVFRSEADLRALSDLDLRAVHRELIRVLVDLHAVPYREVGLAELGRPEGFAARQVRRWRRQWGHVATRNIPAVDSLYRALSRQTWVQGEATLVHGDYRVDNTIIDMADAGRILALVDWEMSTIGDPLTDVAMMCAYQHHCFDFIAGERAASTSDRWPGVDAVAHDYSVASGRDLLNFDQYLALAYFKLAVIAEGIYSRYLVGVGSGPGFATSGAAVDGLIASGLSILAAR
jgi:aminoglycoside phosphotransferase (APT) family kinase protein